MTKGYIFDYGGTIDTGGCHWGRFIWKSYKKCGVPVNWQQFREAYIFTERRLCNESIIEKDWTMWQTLDTKLRIQMEWLEGMGYWYAGHLELAVVHTETLNHLYDQVKAVTKESHDVLACLKERGKKMAVISNFYGNIGTVLHEFGLDDLFTAVFESAVVGVRKPDPRLLQLGIDALQLPAEEITVVGDNMAKDILPAKSLGCHTVWLKGEPWDDNDEQTASQEESRPDRVITSLQELIE